MFERRRRPGGLRIRKGISDREDTVFRKEGTTAAGIQTGGAAKNNGCLPA
jgi:hypothetical protein